MYKNKYGIWKATPVYNNFLNKMQGGGVGSSRPSSNRVHIGNDTPRDIDFNETEFRDNYKLFVDILNKKILQINDSKIKNELIVLRNKFKRILGRNRFSRREFEDDDIVMNYIVNHNYNHIIPRDDYDFGDI